MMVILWGLQSSAVESRQRESTVFSGCPACRFSVRSGLTTFLPSVAIFLCMSSHLNSSTPSPRPSSEPSHYFHFLPSCYFNQVFFFSLLFVCFFEQCCTTYNMSDLAHYNTFQPKECMFSNNPEIFSQILSIQTLFLTSWYTGQIHDWTVTTHLSTAATILYATLLKCT